MINKKLLSIVLALGSLLLTSCNNEPQPVSYAAPVVYFPMENDVVDATVGTPVTFEVKLVEGEKVSLGWYVDDVLESSNEVFTHTFTTPGSFTVRFVAKNGSATVERSYTAIVADTFDVVLSVGDSLKVNRMQLAAANVAAIVNAGSNITHMWKIDGELAGEEAYLGVILPDAREYLVSYHGENEQGSLDRTFTIVGLERPLEMSYSIRDDAFSIKKGEQVSITATPIYGGTGLQHSWKVDGVEVSTTDTITWSSNVGGLFTITYDGVNAKGETASKKWLVTVVQLGYMLDDFETGDVLKAWWTLKQNTPGIELVDNPDQSGINKSKKCIKDSVTGTGGTSGYFDLKGSEIKKAGIDMTQYNSIRLKVHLGKNPYYPRIQVGGTKYAPVTPPKFNNEWEELLFQFPANFTAEQTITFRPLLKQDGNNIPSGPVTDTNTRTVYIDDIEFLN